MDNVDKRLNYLDNLKLVLTMSVIVFHVAIIYGPIGGWYYYERGNDLMVNIPLASIVIYLDAFFMSLFFFISGYVTPSEYDRKGARMYLHSKLKRLGIPFLIFIVTLSPVQEFIKMRYVEHAPFSFVDYYSHDVITLRNICPGQLWFVCALLVFSIVYMFLREIFRSWNYSEVKTPLSLPRTI
ncbi:MAG TPA: acyltransferase family protein, partial [Spirochaetota bacterium]